MAIGAHMKQNLEVEFKTLLTFVEYTHLLRTFFKNATSHQQINTYFDTDTLDLLKENKMIRIRQKGHVQEFTMKIPVSEHSVMEHSFTQEEIRSDDPKVVEFLKSIDVNKSIHPISKSDTLRTTVLTDFGEFALDQTTFDQSIDYELELEMFDNTFNGEELFFDFLEEYCINYKPASPKFLRSLVDFKVIDKLPPKY